MFLFKATLKIFVLTTIGLSAFLSCIQNGNDNRDQGFSSDSEKLIPVKIEIYSDGFIDSVCKNCLPFFKGASHIDDFMESKEVFFEISDKKALNQIYKSLIMSQISFSKRKQELHTFAFKIIFKSGYDWKLSYSEYSDEKFNVWSLNQSILIKNDSLIVFLRNLHPEKDLTNYSSGIGRMDELLD